MNIGLEYINIWEGWWVIFDIFFDISKNVGGVWSHSCVVTYTQRPEIYIKMYSTSKVQFSTDI